MFEYKFRFEVEKKTKKNLGLAKKNFCCRHQKMLVIHFLYMKIV